MRLFRQFLLTAFLLYSICSFANDTITVQRADSLIKIEPMYMSLSGGSDSHSAASETQRTFDGMAFGPLSFVRNIELERDDGGFALRGEVLRRKPGENWGFGASGWWFDGDEDSGAAAPVGTATGIAIFDSPGDTLAGVFVPSLVGASAASVGVGGLFEDSFFNEIQFRAGTEFEVWKVDLYAVRKWKEDDRDRVEILLGLDIANLEDERFESVTDTRPAVADPTVSSLTDGLRHDGSVDYDVAFGPMVALRGHRSWGKHRLGGLLSQAFAFTDVERTSLITEFVEETSTAGAVNRISTTTLSSSSSGDSEIIPITEVKLEYLFDATNNLTLGLGGFLSVWWDAPVAPTGNRENEDTLVFLGFMLTGELRF